MGIIGERKSEAAGAAVCTRGGLLVRIYFILLCRSLNYIFHTPQISRAERDHGDQ